MLVRRGEIVIETRCGRCFFFERGTVMWLADLPVASLHNRGRETAVLVSAARPAEMR